MLHYRSRAQQQPLRRRDAPTCYIFSDQHAYDMMGCQTMELTRSCMKRFDDTFVSAQELRASGIEWRYPENGAVSESDLSSRVDPQQ